MIGSYHTIQLESQHNMRSEDYLTKCTHLFINREFTQANHVMNCLANMVMLFEWIFAIAQDIGMG